MLLEGYYFLAFSMGSTRKHKFVYTLYICIYFYIRISVYVFKTEFIPPISIRHHRVPSINTSLFALQLRLPLPQAGLVFVPQSCLTLCNPRDYRPPGCSVHGILQARILEWVAISFSRGSSRPKDRTHIPCTGRRILYCEPQGSPIVLSMLNVFAQS